MKLRILSISPEIIIAIVSAAVALLAVAAILYFTVFTHIRQKNQVRELSRRFEYLHALLFGQDSQYIRRLDMIARTNLLYVDLHMKFHNRYKEIRDKKDSSAQAAINNLKDLLNEHRFKDLKNEFPQAKQVVDVYETAVNSLNDDLMNVIKPEEDCRQSSLLLKEDLRVIKQDYYVKQADLSLVSSSFDVVFKNLQNLFDQFEQLVESAQYNEAKELLPRIGGIIKELGSALKQLPDICSTIQTLIPDKISSLKDKYTEMRRADYPLYHIISMDDFEEMNVDLERISAKVQRFDLREATNKLDAIIHRIDGYVDAFDKEKEARIIFDRECESIYLASSAIDKKYIKLSNSIPGVKKIFVITEEEQANIDAIKNLISKSDATKRNLDALIHAASKQPYSLLVEKMHNLSNETEAAASAIEDFNKYLFGLKSDCESANLTMRKFYEQLQQSEILLTEIGIDSVSEKYREKIEYFYSVIDDIYKHIKETPIDVTFVNKAIALIKGQGGELTYNVKTDYEAMKKADASILFANRKRKDFAEVDYSLKESETLYFNGEFQQAYDATKTLIQSKGN